MPEDVSPMVPASTVARDSKWVAGLAADSSVGEVAHCVLAARLQAVWHWLPLAAVKWEEDVKYVHQLRTSTRRAMAAVRAFADLLPKGAADDLRVPLRRIRVAADEARDLDVLRYRWLACGDDARTGVVCQLFERIETQRRQAQPRILDIHRELTTARRAEQFENLVKGIPSQGGGWAGRKFERQAHRCLQPVVKRFFRAAEGELATDHDLHALRLWTKKLRYAMEIVSVAFEPAFRETLYPRLGVLQNLLGAVHDHAAAQVIFRDWLVTTPEPEHRAFLAGLLFAEARAHQDLREAFLTQWTPVSVTRLRRQFRLYCGLNA